jgi:hypothetical protein
MISPAAALIKKTPIISNIRLPLKIDITAGIKPNMMAGIKAPIM